MIRVLLCLWALASLLVGQEIVWKDAATLQVEGKGWADTKAFYDRLPAGAEGVVTGPVWKLSRHSAGLCVRFATRAPDLHVRWELTSSRLAMPHMAATGVSGVDLYLKTKTGWRWVATPRPSAQRCSAHLVGGLDGRPREWMLYLPLYNGVRKLELGVPKGQSVGPPSPRRQGRTKPIVFYGTSITQGACASRPGMCHAAILGRRLDRPVINLGFSGNGKMDPELGDLLAELDAALYVIDCLPNMNASLIGQRAVPLVRKLRKARPSVPIVLVEDRTYGDAHVNQGRARTNRQNRAALRAAYEQLVGAGVGKLTYVDGASLLGGDGEATVDGSHPTDLGFVRQSDALEPVLRKCLR